MPWTIYCHIHVESGRRYVGLTKHTMMHRWNQHCAQSKSAKGGRWHFPNAIRKYGPQAFSHEVLEVCETLEEGNAAEERWIEELGTRDPERGFNLTKGGQHIPHPIRKNPWNDPEYRKKQAARGDITAALHTPEARAKHKIAVNSPVYRMKKSEISKRIFSNPELIAKASAAARNKIWSPEARRRAIVFASTILQTPEVKAARQATFNTVESKARRSLASKKSLSRPEVLAKMSTKGRVMSLEEKARRADGYKMRQSQRLQSNIPKMCKIHGPLTLNECYIYRSKENWLRIKCKKCWNKKCSHQRQRQRSRMYTELMVSK